MGGVMSETVKFLDCVEFAIGVPELVAEFDRLTGSNLSRRGTPLEAMIDDAAGRTDAEIAAFVEEFVRDLLPPEARQP
jgi:hypothetical protein